MNPLYLHRKLDHFNKDATAKKTTKNRKKHWTEESVLFGAG